MDNKPKILIVDDTPLMAKLTQKAVESFGYETDIRENSTRAVSYVGNHEVDVILMDIELADSLYDGIETCKVIKSKYSIPIIFLTGHENAQIFLDAHLSNTFDVLIKPYDNKMLKMHIDIAIQNSKVEKKYRIYQMWLNYMLNKSEKYIFILDDKGKILISGNNCEELTDYSAHLTIEKDFLDVLPLTIDNGEEGFFFFTFDEFERAYSEGNKFKIKLNNSTVKLKLNMDKITKRGGLSGYFIEIEKY